MLDQGFSYLEQDSMSKKILIVDDDPDILDALQFMLEEEGYQVRATEKGDYAEQLPKDSTELPDLIILDVLLSGKDGRTIAQKLKSDQKTKQIPIIMISAHPTAEDSARRCGADDFLAKPFDIQILLDKVKNYAN